MKLFYLFFLALGLLLGRATPARAQFLWQRLIGKATANETGEYMIPVAGGFVTLGTASSATASANAALYLSKVNYRGDTVWTKRWTFRQVDIIYPKGLIEDATGNLVVCANTLAPLATPTSPIPPNQGLLVKLTATGDTLWTRTLPSSGPNSSGFLSLVLGNNGSYVAVGEYATLPVLVKYSPAGALLLNLSIPYSSTIQGYLQNIVAVPNGYLLLCPPSSGNLPCKYITVDEQGIYQGERLGGRVPSYQLQRDSQGNILTAGVFGVTKLTPIGDTIWSHTYRRSNRTVDVKRLVETPAGNYLVAGTRNNGIDNDIDLILVDHNGLQLRDTLLVRFQSEENVAGVALTPVGDYVIAGGTNSGQNGRPDQLVFALRNWSRFLPTATRQPAIPDLLAAYPNPTTDAATLEAADGHPLTGNWTLYDIVGRAVQKGMLPGVARPRISIAEQPAGLYLLRLTDAQRHTTQTLRLEKK
ncbi:T9SS type A sorting domain-containing protein [Hymenobacter rubidus]|uniref:T9SS type A sorting domain-containing protein n=1 Tax=Hymenobacter rubidus TaxID=1441626 RepID=UPI00191D7108|nr:T9SS type A sorting domain-containing protein [Hymenobacter rubidus]